MTDPYSPPSLPAQSNQPQQSGHQQAIGENAGMRMLLPVGRSGWAIAAGYLGLFGLVLFPAPLALIVSVIAILDIRKSKYSEKPKHGMVKAIFGLIVGIVGTLILAAIILNKICKRK